jgi:hypothetical protein
VVVFKLGVSGKRVLCIEEKSRGEKRGIFILHWIVRSALLMLLASLIMWKW